MEYAGRAKDRAKAEAGILAHKLFRRWVDRDAHGALVLSWEKVAAESVCDGTFVSETSPDRLSAAQVALGYEGLLRVEQAWFSFKHSIDIQPVFLRKDERIDAHVTLCMLTYLLERWAELLRGLTIPRIRQTLRRLHAGELVHDSQSLWQRGQLECSQERILKKRDIAIPPEVLHVGSIPILEADPELET